MKDILQQIQNLKEDFSSILEDAVRKAERRNLDKTIKADHKEVKDLKKNIRDCWRKHSHYLSPSQDSEKIDNERMGHVKKLKDTITKGNEKLLKRDELNKREAKEAGKEQLATDKAQSNKFSLTSESSDILQQIQSLKEDFMNLIEVEGLGQPASDVPPSTNKIKKDKKTKNGKVELVSVEDELFPYDGNKREQYRQKILDKINGMIQGTATLDDLLQVVRQKKMPVKEDCGAALNRLHVERDKEAEGVPSRSKEMYELNKKYKKLEKKVKRHYNKSLEEALQLLESIILEAKPKDPEGYKKNIDIANHYDHLYSISPAKAPDGSPNSVAAEWNRRYQHYFNKAMKCYYGDGSKKKDSIKEALQLLEGWAKDKRPEAAKKSIDGRRREYLNKLANVLDAADIYGSENVPDGDIKDLDRAEGRYAHAKKVSKIKEALQLLEGLFVNDGRGDLIDDTIMNKPGWTRKKLQDVVTNPIKKFAKGCQRKVNENFDKIEENEYNKCKALILWEQVISEIEDGAVNRAVDSARGIIAFVRKIQGMSGSKEFKDKVEDAIAKKNHQIEVVNSKKEDNVIKRAKEDEAKKKKRK